MDDFPSDRWQKIEHLYHAALSLDTERRNQYLERECGADEALKHSVAELLAQDPAGVPILDQRIWASQGFAGMRLGVYQLEAPLGEGGMGAVFQAEDTRLGRKVAIKISHEGYSKRFEREARAIAALNHPAICTLYDAGPNYLVMELLEGETLAGRIQRGPLPAAEVLSYGRQIADALTEAHAHGIVHRDLKPANIMLTRNGLKVLDFGLARLTSGGQTLTDGRAVMGTPAYMAPEQVKGQPAGPAADLFAFGLVLYEMATGNLPIPDGSLGSARANGLTTRIPSLPRDFPSEWNAMIAHLLEGAPERRPASTLEVRDRLAMLAASPPPSRHLARAALAVAVLLLAALAIWWAGRGVSAKSHAWQVSRVATIIPLPGQQSDAVFSPDGRTIAFSWSGESSNDRGIYILPAGGQTPVRLTRGSANDVSPAWSPDGSQIAFLRFQTTPLANLMVAPAAGGQERLIRSIELPENLRWAMRPLLAWTPGGKSVVYPDNDEEFSRTSLFLTELNGGGTRRLFSSTEGTLGDTSPSFTNDGKWMAYTAGYGPYQSGLFVRSVGPGMTAFGRPQAVTTGGDQLVSSPVWSPDARRLIFVQGAGIFEWQRESPPLRVYQGTSVLHGLSAVWSPGGPPRLLTAGSPTKEGWMLPLRAGGLEAAGPPVPFPSSGMELRTACFSPDGKSIAFASRPAGVAELWVADADGTHPRQLTHLNSTTLGFPRWSPDSRLIAAHAWVGPRAHIFIIDPHQTDAVRKLTDLPFAVLSPTWSLDGKYLYASRMSAGSRQMRISSETGSAEDLFEGSASMVSSDGRKIVYGKLGHPGLFSRSLQGEVASNPEEKLVDDYQPPGADLNPFADGVYYINWMGVPKPRTIRFYSYALKKSLDIAVINDTSPPPDLTVSPDRTRMVYNQFTGRGTGLTLIEFR